MLSFGEFLENKFQNEMKCQCKCKACKDGRCDLCSCKECKSGKKCPGCNCDKKHVYANVGPDPLKAKAKAKVSSKFSSDEEKSKKVRIIGDLETTRRFR